MLIDKFCCTVYINILHRRNLGSFVLDVDHTLSRVLLSLSDSIVDFPRAVIAYEFPTVFSCFEAVTGGSLPQQACLR